MREKRRVRNEEGELTADLGEGDRREGEEGREGKDRIVKKVLERGEGVE